MRDPPGSRFASLLKGIQRWEKMLKRKTKSTKEEKGQRKKEVLITFSNRAQYLHFQRITARRFFHQGSGVFFLFASSLWHASGVGWTESLSPQPRYPHRVGVQTGIARRYELGSTNDTRRRQAEKRRVALDCAAGGRSRGVQDSGKAREGWIVAFLFGRTHAQIHTQIQSLFHLG